MWCRNYSHLAHLSQFQDHQHNTQGENICNCVHVCAQKKKGKRTGIVNKVKQNIKQKVHVASVMHKRVSYFHLWQSIIIQCDSCLVYITNHASRLVCRNDPDFKMAASINVLRVK